MSPVLMSPWFLFLSSEDMTQVIRMEQDRPVMSEHDSRVQEEYRRLNLEWFAEQNKRRGIVKKCD